MATLSETMNNLLESAIETVQICENKTCDEMQILALKMEKLRCRQQSYFWD